jgi:hypothetical protein
MGLMKPFSRPLDRPAQRFGSNRGQSLLEFALIMPFILLVALGVIEIGYALLDQHVVTKLTREGSNLISRDVKINDVVSAMRTMSTRPVDFDTRSRMILTVLRKGGTPGTANYDQVIVYQRHEFGSGACPPPAFAVPSRLAAPGRTEALPTMKRSMRIPTPGSRFQASPRI